MSAIRYRRELGGMEALSDNSHQEASEGRGDEYTWIQRYWNPDKGRKAVADQMGRAAETVYWEATVSRQDGATEEKRQEVCRYIKETAGQSPNHRGMKKKLIDLMPETPFEGEPMAVTREPNDMEKSLL